MSSHVPPERWADAWAGRVTDRERAAMNLHAEQCAKCARGRARVNSASDTFATIRARTAPELPWDSVRARVHWSVSTERRARERPRRSGALALALAGVGAIAVAFAIASDPIEPPRSSPIVHAAAPALDTSARPAPVPLAGLVNRATGEVMIDGIRPDDLFGRRLAAGTVIATGEGRVDIQFADRVADAAAAATRGAFALGPRSMLELRAFDGSAIELVVEGTVDIEIAPRAPHQRFVVIAGERTIEVRGTQFRVHHDGAATSVACRHGLVAVRDAHGQLELGAARRIELPARHRVADQRVTPLSIDEVNALAEATPMTLPLWNLDALVEGSAPLEIATVGRREVRVDGVELGRAPMRVRVMPGRHTVEAADSAGRYRRAGWIDVAAPGSHGPPARIEVLAEQPPTRDIGARRRQLKAGIDRGRLAACVRRSVKQGLTETYVQIEIVVDGNGAINALNVLDTDLGKPAASCVEAALKDVRFGPGARAAWRERIDL